MTPETQEQLTIRSRHGAILARPVVLLALFSDAAFADVCNATADVIETYLAAIGGQTLKTRTNQAGEFEQFNATRLDRDLVILRNPQPDQESLRLLYDSDPKGWVGTYGVNYYGVDQSSDFAEPDQSTMLLFSLPCEAAAEGSLDRTLGLMMEIASRFPLSSGFACYSLRRTEGTTELAAKEVLALLPRFIALDPCDLTMRFEMKGRTLGAHWIDLIGTSLMVRLGGAEAISASVPDAQTEKLSNGGLLLRNAKLPPLGDVNRFARDIGVMPAAARLLKPTRVELIGLADPDFDAEGWDTRLDERKVEPWDNSG